MYAPWRFNHSVAGKFFTGALQSCLKWRVLLLKTYGKSKKNGRNPA